MSPADKSGKKQLTSLNRNQFARVIFAAAESMGMADRQQIEWLTTQVIERLEQQQQLRQPQPLPGMESLVPPSQRQVRRLPTEAEIDAMVKEILATAEPDKPEEAQSKEEKLIMPIKIEDRASSELNLTENALRVLESVAGPSFASRYARGRFASLRFELAQTLRSLGEVDLAEQIRDEARSR